MAEKFNIQKYMINALIILVIGGIASYLLGGLLATLQATMAVFVTGLFTVIMALLAGYLLYMAKLTNFVEIIILIGIAVGIGSILTAFLPMIAPFMLSAGAFTWSGLVATLFYVALADYIGDKAGY